MLSSHLPRMQCDEFVYDFQCGFLGIVGGYGVCVHIGYEHCAISCMGPQGHAGVNPYRGCAEIVRKSCNLSAVAMQSPEPPHGNRTEPVRLPCRGCAEMVAVTVAPPCRFLACGLHAVPVWGLCKATYMSTDYGLTIFSNSYNFPLNKMVEAAEPVNPYKSQSPPASAQRLHGPRTKRWIRAP